jgi:hypothetical protein
LIAIHHRAGSFSDKWIKFCQARDIPFKQVNCYNSDIVEQLEECEGLMWHWSHSDYRDLLFARQLIYSLEKAGKKAFPDSRTCWHFDDKVGQKYLLECIHAPLIKTEIFYEKKKALDWAESAVFPKVFKLRGGAGAENVWLVKDLAKAKELINQSFGKGFKAKNRAYFFKERLWQLRREKSLGSLLNMLKGLARIFVPTESELMQPVEKNYVYFQEFVPDCDHDIRVVVVGNKAFAIKRMVRFGDFRASGSGKIDYNPANIPVSCLKEAFQISQKLCTQSLALDFVLIGGKPFIVEISYGFSSQGYLRCKGYWDSSLNWNEGKFVPEFFMIEEFLKKLAKYV